MHRFAALQSSAQGYMGAGIAAHLANAGMQVLLLDVVPDALTS